MRRKKRKRSRERRGPYDTELGKKRYKQCTSALCLFVQFSERKDPLLTVPTNPVDRRINLRGATGSLPEGTTQSPSLPLPLLCSAPFPRPRSRLLPPMEVVCKPVSCSTYPIDIPYAISKARMYKSYHRCPFQSQTFPKQQSNCGLPPLPGDIPAAFDVCRRQTHSEPQIYCLSVAR